MTNTHAPPLTVTPVVRTPSKEPISTAPVTHLPPTRTPTVIPLPPPTPFVGVEMRQISPERGLLLAQEANVHWIRRNSLLWANVEPTQGARDWQVVAALEEELQAAASAGMQTVLMVRDTPDWAQKIPGHSCGPVSPEALDAFAQFMADAVTRYKDPPYSVKYWELGNEPDVDPSLVGPTSVFGCWGNLDGRYYGGRYYARMLKAVYPAIKAADPEAQVLIGGLLLDREPAKDELPNPPGRFLEGILKEGGGDYFDIVSFHGYTYYNGQMQDWDQLAAPWLDRGGLLVGKADFLHQVLAAHGYDKPLMLTEAGLLCPGCPSPPPSDFLAAQAAYVPRLYVRSAALGLAATFWYTLDGPGWRESGLLDKEQQPRPAFQALTAMTALLKNARYREPVQDFAGVEGYAFDLPEGEIWVLWSPEGVPVTIPVSPEQQAYDQFGDPLAADKGQLTVGFEAVYLQTPAE